MGLLNQVTKGADLSHPHASGGWLIAASVAILMLAIAAGIGMWLYRSGKNMIGSRTKVSDGIPSMSGVFGDGS